MKTSHRFFIPLLAAIALLASVPGQMRAMPAGTHTTVANINVGPHFDARHTVMPTGLREVLAKITKVPSFARQTGLSCATCHYGFPQLTPFGRLFKLNGYTMTGLKLIGEPNPKKGTDLSLLPIGPISAMMQASVTHVAKTEPGTQNDDVEFPQQLSLFLATEITPHIGTMTQVTYSGASGSLGMDNTDFRFATHTHLAAKDLLFGLTVNNNPSVEDVWNSTPAWGFPYAAPDAAPTPAAATLIDGALAQAVVGGGAYALWNNLVYAEASAYRSAPQGTDAPLDSTATNVIQGVSPYWRLALQHQFGAFYGMVGTYGIAANLYPTGVSGAVNMYRDLAFDTQLEHPFGDGGVIIARSTLIHENQYLNGAVSAAPPGAAFAGHTLETYRFNMTVLPNARYEATAGVFTTTGTRDSVLYAPNPVTGSATGRPRSTGLIGELDYNAWQNVRLSLQGVGYTIFNGSTNAYDGSGRQASDNNTLYFLVWIAF